MTRKMFDKVLEVQRKQVRVKTSDLLEGICDLCHKPYAEKDQGASDEQCDQCPVEAKLRGLLDMAEVSGKIAAYAAVSASCEETLKEVP